MSDLLSAAVDLISSSALKLGNVNFDGYEIPESIPFGGTQQVSLKRLIGGRVIIERLGPSENKKTWRGRFQGSNAMSRARAVDAMRKDGEAVDLVFGGMKFSVVITDFVPIYERSWQIPYSITCEVINDPDSAEDSGGGFLDKSLDDLVGADTLDALGVGDLIGDVSLNQALSTVSSGLQVVGKLTGSSALSRIGGYVGTAQGIANGITSGSMSVLQGVTIGAQALGVVPASLASKLTAIGNAATTVAHSTVVTGLLNRIQTNIGQK